MNQKGFSIITSVAVMAVIVALGDAGTYFVSNRQAQPPSVSDPAPTPVPGAPAAGPITVNGEIACLPKKGPRSYTMECAIGLKGPDGRYYGLKNLFEHDPEYKFSVSGLRVEVSGVFSLGDMAGPGGPQHAKYDVAGTIDVTSIKEITDGGIRSGTGTVLPGEPGNAGLALLPDLPLTSPPQQAVSIKFVVEHRSALSGKTVWVKGVIVGTLLGEKACPSDRGMCAQPSIFLSDTAEKDRNTLYDLRILVDEKEQEKSYPIGTDVDPQVVIDGSKVGVIARKIY